jgi:hypothetical protein
MSTPFSTAAVTLLGASAIACGSNGSTLGAPTTDGGDATARDAAMSRDVSMEAATGEAAVDAADADAALDTATPAPDVNGDAQASDDGNGAEAEAGPYMGSLPAAPTMALFRLANWSPDSPAVDVCIATHGTKAFQGPLVAALAVASQSDAGDEGIAFPLVSAYTLVAPGQYDARVVVAGATSCAVGIRPDTTTLPTLGAGGAETVALIGEVAPDGADYKLHVLGFLDDVSITGTAAIRVINAAPAMPEVDVGTGSLSAKSFLAIFRGVAIGQASAPSEGWIPFLVDANGYNANQPISGATLSAHASMGATIDAVVSTMAFSAPNGSVTTLVVAGGTSSTSPALISCADNAGTDGVLSDCTVLAPAGP